jgi:hypothetical protein
MSKESEEKSEQNFDASFGTVSKKQAEKQARNLKTLCARTESFF